MDKSKMNEGRFKMKWVVPSLIVLSVILLSMVPVRKNNAAFHTMEEWENYLKNVSVEMPNDSVHLFPTANQCKGCHGFDSQMNAMVDAQGNDVNIHDDWSTSMMANSAKDPFWRAKVSHEVLVNPAHKLDLETKCTSCHAPQGHFTSILRGSSHYTIDDLVADTIGLDGVSCGACHMKSDENLENLFSGNANYDTSFVMFGPYEMPFAAPMRDFVGFEPVYSEHINSAGICASCHTLLTESVDLEGNFTGDKFTEQATYHEWINSDFDDEGESPRTCQSCHMPRLEDNIVISANYLFLDPRSPYALHDMIGTNVPMIKLIQNNKEQLNIEAADEHFEETIAKTLDMLQKRSLDTELSIKSIENDTLSIELELKNKAGHKFPSGYPSRRVFVEFLVLGELEDTLFRSGLVDQEYRLIDHNNTYEPHYEMINEEGQVQIYEFVVGDVTGEVTTVLERGYVGLKDNRLPPRGFTKSHSAYDTTRIIGKALQDNDFNNNGEEEGSGSDKIEYRVGVEGYSGFVSVSARIYYQALPPRWLEPMFEWESDEIDSFRSMVEAEDMKPTLVAQDTISNIFLEGLSVSEFEESELLLYPNPSPGIFQIYAEEDIQSIQVFDKLGRLVLNTAGNIKEIDLSSESSGIYIVKIKSSLGYATRKIIIQ